MCASALPGENGTHDVGAEMNKKTSKNIPDVMDCNLKDSQILKSLWYKYSWKKLATK